MGRKQWRWRHGLTVLLLMESCITVSFIPSMVLMSWGGMGRRLGKNTSMRLGNRWLSLLMGREVMLCRVLMCWVGMVRRLGKKPSLRLGKRWLSLLMGREVMLCRVTVIFLTSKDHQSSLYVT